MSLIFALLCLVASVAAQSSHYLYGPQWGWYSTRSISSEYIISAETTLTPGPPPTDVKPRLALWPGLNTNMGLIQPIIVNAAEDAFRGRACGGATASQWCVFASMIKLRQEAGKRVPLSGDQSLRMKFQWNPELNGYDQWLYINDKVVSELHIATGKAQSFYIDSECQGAHKGVVSAHTYTNTTLVWSGAVPKLDKAVDTKYMACADSVTTSDGGKTWKIPTIKVEKSSAPEQFVRGVKRIAAGTAGLCA